MPQAFPLTITTPLAALFQGEAVALRVQHPQAHRIIGVAQFRLCGGERTWRSVTTARVQQNAAGE